MRDFLANKRVALRNINIYPGVNVRMTARVWVASAGVSTLSVNAVMNGILLPTYDVPELNHGIPLMMMGPLI